MSRARFLCSLGLALTLGLVAGVFVGINMNPALADRYVLKLGDLGTWIGAVITAITAGVAIWISLKAEAKAKQSEVELLQLKQSVWPGFIMFELVSLGRLPAYINQVFIVHKDFPGKTVNLGFYFREGDGPIKAKLEHREALQIGIMTGNAMLGAEIHKVFDWQVYDGLSLLIRTSMQEHSGKEYALSFEMVKEISDAYKFKRPDIDGQPPNIVMRAQPSE